MHRTTSRTPPTITADGKGVVSHAGTVLLSELADRIGLTAALSEATGADGGGAGGGAAATGAASRPGCPLRPTTGRPPPCRRGRAVPRSGPKLPVADHPDLPTTLRGMADAMGADVDPDTLLAATVGHLAVSGSAA